MKHINPFDRMIQEQLGNESEDAPMHLWDEIETTISLQEEQQKERKRRWLLLFLFLFTASTSTWLSYENYYTTKLENVSEGISPPITASTQELDAKFETETLSSFENLNADNNSSITTPSLPIATIEKTTTESKNLTATKVKKRAIKNEENLTLALKNQKQKPLLSDNNQNVVNVPSKKVIPLIEEETPISNLESIEVKHHQKNTAIEAIDILPIKENKQQLVSLTVNNEFDFSNPFDKSSTKAKNKTSHKKKSRKKHQQSDYKALNRFFSIAPNPGSCYSFGGRNLDLRGIYVDAVVSPDLSFRTLSTQDSEMQTYKEMREESESYYWAGSAGLRLSVVTNSGFAVRTGLMYAQMTERFKYENLNSEITTIERIKDMNGNIIDSIITVQQGQRYIEHSNHYHMFDIPLIFGYELETQKLVFNFNAGAYFNVFFKSKGRMLSSDLNPIPINNTSVFRKNLGLSYFASMGINYKFNKKIQLVLEPQIRYYPKSFTREDYAISQKYVTFGIFTGLRFRL